MPRSSKIALKKKETKVVVDEETTNKIKHEESPTKAIDFPGDREASSAFVDMIAESGLERYASLGNNSLRTKAQTKIMRTEKVTTVHARYRTSSPTFNKY